MHTTSPPCRYRRFSETQPSTASSEVTQVWKDIREKGISTGTISDSAYNLLVRGLGAIIKPCHIEGDKPTFATYIRGKGIEGLLEYNTERKDGGWDFTLHKQQRDAVKRTTTYQVSGNSRRGYTLLVLDHSFNPHTYKTMDDLLDGLAEQASKQSKPFRLETPVSSPKRKQVEERAQFLAAVYRGKTQERVKEPEPTSDGTEHYFTPQVTRARRLLQKVGEHRINWPQRKGEPITVSQRQTLHTSTQRKLAGAIKELERGNLDAYDRIQRLTDQLTDHLDKKRGWDNKERKKRKQEKKEERRQVRLQKRKERRERRKNK